MVMVEFFLTSSWILRDQAVVDLIEALEGLELSKAEFTFEPDGNWIKVACRHKHVAPIQEAYQETQYLLEKHIVIKPVRRFDGEMIDEFQDNAYLALRHQRKAVAESSGYRAKICPSSFDKFKFNEAWRRMDEMPLKHDMTKMLTVQDLATLQQITNTTIKYNPRKRVAYIGGSTRDDVEKVVTKLDVIFEDYKLGRLGSIHLLCPETEEQFVIDLRYVRLINKDLFQTIIVDPTVQNVYGHYAQGDAYNQIFNYGAALRIARRLPMQKGYQSLFGPEMKAISHEGLESSFPMTSLRFAKKSRVEEEVDIVEEDPLLVPGISTGRQVTAWLEGTDVDNVVVEPLHDIVPVSQTPSECQTSDSGDVSGKLRPSDSYSERNVPTYPPTVDGSVASLQTRESRNAPLAGLASLQSRENRNAPLAGLASLRRPNASVPGGSPAPSRNMPLPGIAPSQGRNAPLPGVRPSQARDAFMRSVDDRQNQHVAGAATHPSVEESETQAQSVDPVQQDVKDGIVAKHTPQTDSHSGEHGQESKTAELPTNDGPSKNQEQQYYVPPHMRKDDMAGSPSATSASGEKKDVTTPNDQAKENKAPAHTTGHQDSTETQAVVPVLQDLADDEASKRQFHVTMRQKAGRKTNPVPYLKRDLAKIFNRLRTKRGRVTFQVDLGRIYLMSPHPSGMAKNEPGHPTYGWDPGAILFELNETATMAPAVVFNKALSTSGYDAHFLTKIKQNGQIQYWKFKETQVFYDFYCVIHGLDMFGKINYTTPEVVVEVDGTHADNFTYQLRAADEDHCAVLVHCIQRNNDIQFALQHSPVEVYEKKFGKFAQELVNSIEVPDNQIGTPVLEFANECKIHKVDGANAMTEIRGVRVRIVNKYESFHGHRRGTTLNLTTYQNMEFEAAPGTTTKGSETKSAQTSQPTEPESSTFTRCRATEMKKSEDPRIPIRWHEAHLTADSCDKFFKQNESLELGEVVEWTHQDIDKSGIVDALLRDGLNMIEKMDGIGAENDNGTRWGPRYIDENHDPRAAESEYYYARPSEKPRGW